MVTDYIMQNPCIKSTSRNMKVDLSRQVIHITHVFARLDQLVKETWRERPPSDWRPTSFHVMGDHTGPVGRKSNFRQEVIPYNIWP